jgi:hypothetical protein
MSGQIESQIKEIEALLEALEGTYTASFTFTGKDKNNCGWRISRSGNEAGPPIDHKNELSSEGAASSLKGKLRELATEHLKQLLDAQKELSQRIAIISSALKKDVRQESINE